MAYRKPLKRLLDLAVNVFYYKDGQITIPEKYRIEFDDLVEKLALYFENHPNFTEILSFLRLERRAQVDTSRTGYFEQFTSDFNKVTSRSNESPTSSDDSDDAFQPAGSDVESDSDNSSSDGSDFDWVTSRERQRDASPVRGSVIDEDLSIRFDIPLEEPVPHLNFVELWKRQREQQFDNFNRKFHKTFRERVAIALWFIDSGTSTQIAKFIDERFDPECPFEFTRRRVSSIVCTDRLRVGASKARKRNIFVHLEPEEYLARSRFGTTDIRSMKGYAYSLTQLGYELCEKLVE